MLYNLAMEVRATRVMRNLAFKMTRYPCLEVQKGSHELERLSELWSALYTSGSNDVVLDELIVWFMLETGAFNLSAVLPRDPDEVEAWMADNWSSGPLNLRI